MKIATLLFLSMYSLCLHVPSFLGRTLDYESSDVSNQRRIVPQHLRQQVLDENHDAIFACHFSAKSSRRNLTCDIIGQR